VAGVALGDIHLHFAWQAWHLRHWAGSGRALVAQRVPCVAGMHWGGSGRALVVQRLPVGAAASRVAGVALGDIHLRFALQAWHWVTSTFTLRGRRGTR